jgi:hypothetical protein
VESRSRNGFSGGFTSKITKEELVSIEAYTHGPALVESLFECRFALLFVQVHKVPLFWLNAGVLMTAFQFLSSLGSQAFIFMQVRSGEQEIQPAG